MFWQNYEQRWNTALFLPASSNDDLAWKQYFERWNRDNPNVSTKDFIINQDQESAFRNGSNKAGYSTFVLQRKRLDYESGRHEHTGDMSLIEVKFTGWSVTTWCAIIVVASIGVAVGVKQWDSIKRIGSNYLGSQ